MRSDSCRFSINITTVPEKKMSFRFVKIKRTITFAADKQSIHPLNDGKGF
ncbi:hypothetical protein M109_2658 [Bacteroides fragilis str. 3397 N2]|nr:hypothetical protein M080_2517 [Bacteroides fragilis str. 3397 T10]EXZ48526.1 hypothetical protein M109_2658 [Bacteroides fragilis str. 3397 N2]EXZ53223.1 hypothetical protein M108_2741 [Bacteroides fragilis str. 3397 T14]EYA43149.1 hypothetical protein M110_2764 [Bacteroides fragilis str. 3397 N3]